MEVSFPTVLVAMGKTFGLWLSSPDPRCWVDLRRQALKLLKFKWKSWEKKDLLPFW